MPKKTKPAAAAKKKVLIVGAGYTGLSAAISLLEKGYSVTIVDAMPKVGGLAADFTIEGEPIEKAYHHFFKTDTYLIDMAKKLGLEDKLVWHKSSMAIVYKRKIWAFTGPLDLLKFKPLHFINRIRAGLVVVFLQKYNNWQALSPQPAYKWMQRFGGKQVYDVIWKPLLIGKFSNDFYQKISMAWLWARVHIRAQSRNNSGTGEMLGYFKGGFSVVTDAMSKKITSLGGEFRMNTRISELKKDSRGYTATLGDGTKLRADDILLATPSDISSFMLAPLATTETQKEYIAKLQAARYVGAVLIVFSSEQSLSNYYWHNVNDAESPFLVFIQHTNFIDPATYNNKHVYYLASYLPHEHPFFEMEPKELEKVWFGHLKKIVPNFESKKIREKHLFRFKKAQHLAFVSYEKQVPDHKSPFDNIYVANFAQIYPEDRGTNYAIRDGEMIAEMIASK
jgi:protoporphyrinogen oxidase